MEIQSLEICRHRYGKRMTYTEQTDGLHYEESYLWMREMLVKRGIKAGVFVSLKDLRSDSILAFKDDVERGVVGADVYSSIYPRMIDRLRKKHRKVGEKEWNDFYYLHLMPAYYRIFGRLPIAISYAYGNDTYKNSVHQCLGGRNSGVDGGIAYQYNSQAEMISRKSTLRWYDDVIKNIVVGGG